MYLGTEMITTIVFQKKNRDDQRVMAGRSPGSADKEALTTFFFLCPQHILRNYRDSFQSSKFQVGVGGPTFSRGGGQPQGCVCGGRGGGGGGGYSDISIHTQAWVIFWGSKF